MRRREGKYGENMADRERALVSFRTLCISVGQGGRWDVRRALGG